MDPLVRIGWITRASRWLSPLFAAACALHASSVSHAQSCSTTVESISDAGLQSTGHSLTGYRYCLSTDGRYVAFTTNGQLIAADTDLLDDAHVRDRVAGMTELISMSSAGTKGNNRSTAAEVTPNGQFVTFASYADNLVATDLNGRRDVFLRDRSAGLTILASVGDQGQQGDRDSVGGALSADGRYIAFWSASTNLVAGDTNGLDDVFVYDATTGTSTCISRNSAGQPAGGNFPVISQDARYVAFFVNSAYGTCGPAAFGNSIRVDRVTGAVDCLNLRPDGTPSVWDCFVTGLSADGRYAAFESSANDLVVGDTNNKSDVFVRDLLLGVTQRVSVSNTGVQGNNTSSNARISANGRFVAFETVASNLVAGANGGWRIVMRDRWTNKTILVSQSTSGAFANDQCIRPSISPDGTCVAFDSSATTLLDGGDMNGFTNDVLVRECVPSGAFSYCVPKSSSIACVPAINGAGTASASSSLPFDVYAGGVINRKFGLLTYSVTGQTLIPFGGGTLCIAPPFKRSPVLNSAGTPPPTWDCTGSFHYDFNAHIQGGVDPALVQGQMVWTQYWYRDPGFTAPDNIGLTDALEFTIE